jgi:DNA-binding NarL/FixJ family response regulator
MSKSVISVLIADDEQLVCDTVALSLEWAGLKVVGIVKKPSDVIGMAAETHPDVVLLDIQMFGRNVLGMLPAMAHALPKLKVVIFSAWSEPDYLARAIVHGAAGYLTKNLPVREIVRAIEVAANGWQGYDRPTVLAAVDAIGRGLKTRRRSAIGKGAGIDLTGQERRILTLLAEGLNNRAIARLLGLAEPTVKSHVRSILSKLHLSDRTSAVVWAYTEGGLRQNY